MKTLVSRESLGQQSDRGGRAESRCFTSQHDGHPARTPAASVYPRRGHSFSTTPSRASTLRGGTMKKTQDNSRRESKINAAFVRLLLAILRATVLCSLAVGTVRADEHKQSKNYILRRQSAGSVTGTPTSRRIIGKREIDIYRNGLMFEKDSVVGVVK